MRKILPLLLALVLLVSLPLPARAAGKYMQCEHADFQIVLDESGGASVTETWECYFGGDTISRYRRSYKAEDPWNMDIWVTEITLDDQPMTLLEQPDKSRPEGCAAVFTQDERVHVEMYLRALNETHTFRICYYVTNAVQLFNDAAEFHWNLTGESEAFDIDRITGTVEIPYGTRDMGLYFWGHGPSEDAAFEAVADEDGMVSRFELYNNNIPRGQAVWVRFAMPRELFPECTRTSDWDGLEEILEEEHGYADISGSLGQTLPQEETWEEPFYEEPVSYEEDQWPWWMEALYEIRFVVDSILMFLLRLWRPFAIAMAFLPTILLLFFHSAFERRAKKKFLPAMYAKYRLTPRQAPRYCETMPRDLKPAMVCRLMSLYPDTPEGRDAGKQGNAFSATVLDLVERGILKIGSAENGELTYRVMAQAGDLTAYEQNVIQLYTEAGAVEEPRTTGEITDYMREKYSWCKSHYREFGTLVDQDFESLGLTKTYTPSQWTREKYIHTGVIWGLLVAAGMLAGGGVFSSLILGAVAGLVNTIMLSRLDCFRRPDFQVLTQEGEDRYAMWKAWGDYLRDFSDLSGCDAREVGVWREALVYATALGCGETAAAQLRIAMPQVYDSLMRDYDPTLDAFRYDEIVNSVNTIDTENSYTIRSTSSSSWSSDWSSSDSGGDWGGFSDSGGDCDSGSCGSDFD